MQGCIVKKGLLFLFTEDDFKKPIKGASYDISDIVLVAYVTNKSTGERLARAVMSDGTAFIKPVTAKGGEASIEYVIPAYRNTSERNSVIVELADKPELTQEMIAAMMDISQSTVSNVLRNA